MKPKSNQSERKLTLQNYSAFSAAFLTMAASGSAQMVYTDVDPDLQVYIDDIGLDMDGNGTNDFKLVFLSESFASFAPNELKMRINPLGDNQVAYSIQNVPVTYSGTPWYTYNAGATQIMFTNIPLLNEGAVIDEAFNFQSDLAVLFEKLFFYIYSSSNIEPIAGGLWNGTTNHFAAVHFYTDGAYHYGWLRLNVSVEEGITLLDYAYELTPETPITTAIKNYSTSWFSVADAGISETAADLNFNFSAAGDEVDIDEYRVVCVKSDITDFNVDDANSLSSDRYISIIPDGSADYAGNFISGGLDSDGDAIVAGQEYQLYVLNVMSAASNYLNILSQASMPVILVDTVAAAIDLSIADVFNNGDATDIRVNFSAPAIEQGIMEYRVIIAQKDDADIFTIDDALALDATRYTTVLPGLEAYELFLSETILDVAGNVIVPDKYKVFILSIPDGTSVVNAQMTEASNIVSLEQATSQVAGIVLEDISDIGNGEDIKISFPIPAFEQTIASYRVFLVDFATAFSFNLDAALASTNYFEVTPAGTDIILNGDATTRDSQGNLITWGVPYYAYVLSMASDYGIGDTLSAPSNQIILNFPVEIANNNLNTPVIFSAIDGIHVALNNNDSGIFELYNTAGQLITTTKLITSTTIIPTTQPTGIYITRVFTSRKWYYSKIQL